MEASFLNRLESFAQKYILTRPDLGKTNLLPEEIRTAMGEQGLLDPWMLADPGQGLCGDVAAGAMTLVEAGGCLGLALSWIVHHLVSRALVFSSLGGVVDEKIRADIRAGKSTICFAVSEPDAGAHPKYLTARAREETGGFVLNGRKAFLTNGPIAGHFLVVAITGQNQKRKEFSAFLVGRNTPGLKVAEPMEIPFFKPCPHGEISLENCMVSKRALVGIQGDAWPAMVLPFRKMEDAVMTGPVAGAMAVMLERAAVQMKGVGSLGRDEIQVLGALKAQVDAAGFLSRSIARMADQPDLPEHRIMDSLIMHFRQSAALFLAQLKAVCQKTGCPPVPPADILERDLSMSGNISKRTREAKQEKMGTRLLVGDL